MGITLGQVAGIIAALAALILVIALIRPLAKLGGVLDSAAASLKELTEHTLPAIDEAAQAVRDANGQIARVDAITAAAARTAEDVSAMTTLITSTIAAPFLAIRKGAEKVKSFFVGEPQSGAPRGGSSPAVVPNSSESTRS